MYPSSSSNVLFLACTPIGKDEKNDNWAPCVNADTSKHLDFHHGLCSVLYLTVPKTGAIKTTVVSALKLLVPGEDR